jgi:hypothetical protein
VLPSSVKWINTCALCGAQGYRPELNNHKFVAAVLDYQVKKVFDELTLDERGLCPKCSPLVKSE